jgi:hypothetical protein
MAHPSHGRGRQPRLPPLFPIFASLVVANLLQPLNMELCERAATRLQNIDPGDDGFGGITHLLGYVDNISTCVPLTDLKILCDQFATIGASLGYFINPLKTRILTSTSGHSPLPDLHQLNPTLTTSIFNAISQYSTQQNDINILGPQLPAEHTTGLRLLGSPVGSPTFTREYFNTQLVDIQVNMHHHHVHQHNRPTH